MNASRFLTIAAVFCVLLTSAATTQQAGTAGETRQERTAGEARQVGTAGDVSSPEAEARAPDLFDTGETEAGESQAEHLMPARKFLLNTPLAPLVKETLREKDLRKRPMLYWRRWADKPIRPAASLLFIVLFNSLAYWLVRKRMEVAARQIGVQFWRSLGRGVLILAVAGLLIRVCFQTQVFSPLAVLIVAVLQLGLLLGLSAASYLIGARLLARTGAQQHLLLDSRPLLSALVNVLTGSLIVWLVLMIPGVGGLPRIGPRLVMLLCLLGLGALSKTLRDSEAVTRCKV